MPPDVDIITLEEAKRGLRIKQVAELVDAEIAVYVSAVSARLDDLCGPIIVRDVEELRDGGCCSIKPRETPVFEVTQVTEYSNLVARVLSAETNTAKSGSDYLLDGDGHHGVWIRRRSNNADAQFPLGRQNVALEYRAGRFETIDDVTDKFRQAATLMLTHLWKPEMGLGNSQLFGDQPVAGAFHEMPLAVLKLLGSERRLPAFA
jgi:hypothetical protein